MKAILAKEFGGPETMKPEEVPDLIPGRHQVLVRLEAAGVNPVDVYILSGNYARKPALPYTPGMDGAGIVTAVGMGVKKIKKDARVYVESPATGTYARFCLADAANVHPLPPNVTFAQGAALGVPYATAQRALFGKAKAQKGETVLVHGASGGVGIAAVQLAKAAKLKVIGTAGSEQGLQLVKEQGAHHVLNHKDPSYLEILKEITGGKGVDIILEMAAHLNLGKDLIHLATKGRVVVIGSRGPVEINPRDLMGRDGSVMAFTLFNTTPEEKDEIHKDLFKGLKSGALKPVIGKEFPLDQAGEAHKLVMQPGSFGKVVLIP
ncbi:MAG TPA: NADPH:quinone reductase [bacterium]|nr:NADPH:quinone reductase [bacterium]